MPMKRNVLIEVNTRSWKRKRVPAKLSALDGTVRQMDVELALLHTAIWTRPPNYTGFDLADCWAWLRYARAFDSGPDLRLRNEWTHIDPHQKTILSDEVGVGFTTCLFWEILDFNDYADTLSVRDVLPDKFRLKGSKKVGPRKSPDYIARDRQGRFSILECKGTQTSVNVLEAAIRKGVSQKRNIVPVAGTKLAHSLVAGLFIPQASSNEQATVCISDPEADEHSGPISGVPAEDLTIAMTQISLAKQFALIGFVSVANELAAGPIEKSSELQDALRAYLRILRQINRDYLEFETRLPLPPEDLREHAPASATAILFNASAPFTLIDRLANGGDLRAELLKLSDLSARTPWETVITDTSVKLRSPYGFSFGLIYEGPMA